MTELQRLWWQQASSDHKIYRMLRAANTESCHQLHYLQMTMEKLAKAYLWRTGKASRVSHVSVDIFLRSLMDRSRADLESIAAALNFKSSDHLETSVRSMRPMARQIELLAPSLAADGPNAEYPWPHHRPVHTPESFDFPIWRDLTETGRGRAMLAFVEAAVVAFPRYA